MIFHWKARPNISNIYILFCYLYFVFCLICFLIHLHFVIFVFFSFVSKYFLFCLFVLCLNCIWSYLYFVILYFVFFVFRHLYTYFVPYVFWNFVFFLIYTLLSFIFRSWMLVFCILSLLFLLFLYYGIFIFCLDTDGARPSSAPACFLHIAKGTCRIYQVLRIQNKIDYPNPSAKNRRNLKISIKYLNPQGSYIRIFDLLICWIVELFNHWPIKLLKWIINKYIYWQKNM